MLNEFRQDLVSGEWVLFATGRSARPVPDQAALSPAITKDKCPFEDPEGHGNEVLETYPALAGTGWFAKVAKNKFPVVNIENSSYGVKLAGPFSTHDAHGRHELVIFGDHDKPLHQFSVAEMSETFRIYQQRLEQMAREEFARYVLIFHNHGPRAGASLTHPHTQIMSLPLLPPDVERSVRGAERFYHEKQQWVYDQMLDWERQEGKRIVFENKHFIAFCPFVSKFAYEVRIFPKVSQAHFEQLSNEQHPVLAEALLAVLQKYHAVLKNPDFNFYIHSAPREAESKAHSYYTWHVELVPKLGEIGAFELGSGIVVNATDPDKAAAALRAA